MEAPSFFYQDYMLISEEILNLYSVQEVLVAPMMFDDTIKEITENKRSYLLAVVIENEIARLKQQRNGKWKGKEHVSAEEQRITIDKSQEKDILELFQNKYKIGTDLANHELIRLVADHNLSLFYKQGQTKKICSLLRELTKLLGNEWGELAAFKTTNGEKTIIIIFRKTSYFIFFYFYDLYSILFCAVRGNNSKHNKYVEKRK